MGLYDLLGGDKSGSNDKMTGVWIGVVTNNSDGNGIVRVKFPWRECEDECPARVATLMAGNDMGTYFLPEVGDEVLVAFGQGNIDDPYIIGALWNGVDKTPGDNSDGKNNIRKIKSRSGHEITFTDDKEQKAEKLEIKTKGGHSIVLDDTSDKEMLGIKTKAGHTITLDDASGKEKMEMKTKAGHTITLDDASGGEKIAVKDKTGSNSIVIDSVQNGITIESTASLKIKSQMIEIEAGATMTIKSGAMLTIQGSLVKIN